MSLAYILAGLGFGDEGKGSITEFLCARDKADLVVRYNGGAQAAHNVVADDGRHHTFSQFGSGTLQGAKTYLSRFMIVDPLALLKEAKHLEEIGVSNPFELLSVDRECPVITPFHIIANLAKEHARGHFRHGTCGMGVGETVVDWMDHPQDVPLVGDILNPVKFARKMRFIRDLKHDQLMHNPAYCEVANEVKVGPLIDRYSEFARRVCVVGRNFLKNTNALKNTVVFEGAQGVLLDQDFGFQPHTTWSNTTFENANTLLDEAGFSGDIVRMGITRSYQTRHGQGPMPTECAMSNREQHNDSRNEQGEFRNGWLDMTLMRYAIDVLGGVDEIAVTHLDGVGAFRICTEYNAPADTSEFYDPSGNIIVNRPGDYDYQCQLTKALGKVMPSHMYSGGADYETLPGIIEEQMNKHWNKRNVAVTIGSFGPRLSDKHDISNGLGGHL